MKSLSNLQQYNLSITRLLIGLLQGFLLYFLYLATDTKSWPATDRFIYVPLLMIALFVPLIAAQSIGNMRSRTLVLWLISITLILAGTAYYDAWLDIPLDPFELMLIGSPPFIIFSFIGIFITQSLILSGDAERHWLAPYTTYFDNSWKLAVQLILAVLFLGIFWLLLWLGAALFDAIGMDLPRTIITKSWFAIPATTLAIASALHITDVKVGIVRGIRTLNLMLLSWLLPLVTIIVTGFLLTLIFSGLTPLWETKRAVMLLLCATIWTIILINATYRDGTHVVSAFLRYCGTLSAFLLAPMVLLMVYGLSLRVGQYGWTSARVIAAAGILIIAFYALGYALAALKQGPWLKKIEITNITVAFLIIAILFAMLTPIANPTRLSVNNQLARLASGKVAPDKFDLTYLRWDAKHTGLVALKNLANDATQPAVIRDEAKRLLSVKNKYDVQKNRINPTNKIILHTKNATLPDSFVQQQWTAQEENLLPFCLRYGDTSCDALIRNMNGKQTILIFSYNRLTAFQQNSHGIWEVVSAWNTNNGCQNVSGKIKNDQFNMVPAKGPQWPDLEIAGQRFQATPASYDTKCPSLNPKTAPVTH